VIEVWTDGACHPNPGIGGWGWTRSDGVEKWGGEVETTNNRMELRAIINALESLPENSYGTLYSDSRYCVDGANSWMFSWARRGWPPKIKNRDLWERLLEQRKRQPNVRIRWVRGHADNPGNERADALAEVGRSYVEEAVAAL
jgi:ribonuclease HI